MLETSDTSSSEVKPIDVYLPSPRRNVKMLKRESLPSFPAFDSPQKMKRLSVNYTTDMQLSKMNIVAHKVAEQSPLCASSHKVLRTYFVERTSSLSLRGRTYTYTLVDDSNIFLFSSKTKKRYPTEIIGINTGDSAQINGDYDFELDVSMENTHFILKPKNSEKVMMVFDAKPECSLTKTPRNTGVVLYKDNGDLLEMVSREPTRLKGDWKLDFGERFAIPSEKNTILQQSTNQRVSFEFLAIRKISKNTIACDCGIKLDPIIVFGIGLSIFNARIKA
jgi:hypothetical protein